MKRIALALALLVLAAGARALPPDYYSLNYTTSTSGVYGTSMFLLTPSASASLFIDNSCGSGPVYFVITNVSPPTINTNNVRLSVAAGSQLNFNVAQFTLSRSALFFHWINATVESCTPTAQFCH